MDELSQLLQERDFSQQKNEINHIFLEELYDAKWIPYAVWAGDLCLLVKFTDIIEHTRKSKNRIKKIDELMLSYYTKSKLEYIRKDWRDKGQPPFKIRMMNQAVQAYYRNEYVLTVTTLSTMWEGFIYEKVHDTSGKKGKKPRKI